MKRILIFTIFLILTAFVSMGQADQWQVDKDHSEIKFEVQHIFSLVSGRFSDFKGDIVFNPDSPNNSHFNFSVTVKSVNTFNGKRDSHLRSKDFFHADEYPVMTFKSTKMTHLKDNIYSLEGLMTIKDVTKPLQMEVYHFGPLPHPFDKKSKVTGFNTSFMINRLDYHVGNGKFVDLGVVKNKVKVDISMEVLKKQ